MVKLVVAMCICIYMGVGIALLSDCLTFCSTSHVIVVLCTCYVGYVHFYVSRSGCQISSLYVVRTYVQRGGRDWQENIYIYIYIIINIIICSDNNIISTLSHKSQNRG